jgi:poly-gamma-glutamate capsule biosynthesis protein CapA/YwtB (metallophosphatase superfamily)
MKAEKLLWLLLSMSAVHTYAQDTTRLSLLFIGDIMQHDSQIASAYDAPTKTYDYTSCFQFIAPTLRAADITIGNLEVTLAGPPYKGYPQFSAPDQLAYTLRDAGVDVLVTANNHCVDRGQKGLERTIALLDTIGVRHTGTFVDSAARNKTYPLILEKNGFRLSLLNYTFSTNGISVPTPNIVNQFDTLQIKNDLRKAKTQNTDAIIVFMHWGVEYQNLPHASQKKMAEFCFRNGAKLVIGAHPHVLQPMEWRRDQDQLLAYSLGNFVSGQRDRYKNGGALLNVALKKITDTDSTSRVSIDSASYALDWIYRTTDTAKDYYIMPLPQFEGDTLFVKSTAGRSQLNEFAHDSRALFSKHNVGVNETNGLSEESMSYKIQLSKMMVLDSVSLHPSLHFYGAKMEKDMRGVERIVVGDFFDQDLAKQAFLDIRKTIDKDARIILYFESKRVSD